jgi:hypothetical protein
MKQTHANVWIGVETMNKLWALRRCTVVWLMLSTGICLLLRWLAGAATGASQLIPSGEQANVGFDELLPSIAVLALGGCAVWFWVVSTVVTLEAAAAITTGTLPLRLVGSPTVGPTVGPAGLRRLVFAACGVALLSAGTAPALATDQHRDRHTPVSAPDQLAGLRLPDRAAYEAHRPPGKASHEPAATIRVGPGDTLWGIAASVLGPDATPVRISRSWQRIYLLNTAAIGPDPDLIRPGTSLSIPDLLEEQP